MIESALYLFRQLLGYRLLCFDAALNHGIPLTGYTYWAWYPWWKMGTYRELKLGCYYKYVGFGTDK